MPGAGRRVLVVMVMVRVVLTRIQVIMKRLQPRLTLIVTEGLSAQGPTKKPQ